MSTKTYNRKNIFATAWNICRTYGETFAAALRRAWAMAKLRATMATKVVRFYFTKIDGTIREAWGTLNPSTIPATEATSNRKPNPSVFTYFDTEKQGWRCFKIMNLHI